MLFGSKLIVFFAVTAATITGKFGKNYKNFGYQKTTGKCSRCLGKSAKHLCTSQKSFPFVLAEFLFDV
jgi:hypothetical protein